MRNILKLAFLLIFLCGTVNAQQVNVKYYQLIVSEGNPVISNNHNDLSKVENGPYMKVTFENQKIVKIEFFKEHKIPLTNNYLVPVVLFHYDSLNRASRIELYDQFNQRIEDQYSGYWAIEFTYDTSNRIVNEFSYSKLGKLIHYIKGIDIQPAIIRYRYLQNGLVSKIEFNDDSILIDSSMMKLRPTVPYLDMVK